jgi:2-octaprenyl-6-methoxyphenol hydroxylase
MDDGHDLVIVGGGPVGAALALALAGTGRKVALYEARADLGASSDDRTLAISYGSSLVLQRLGIWDALPAPTPIDTIHVSQQGGFGRSLLTAADSRVPALGYVLRYAGLQRALGQALARNGDVAVHGGASVEQVDEEAGHAVARVRIDGSTTQARARLLVIADGGVRLAGQAGAVLRSRDYEQQAVVGNVRTSAPHAARAYERFCAGGPVALLPFEDRFALIWTASPAHAAELVDMPEAAFLSGLQAHFGDRAGRFLSVSGRARFPLSLRYAEDPVVGRIVLLGNAAQALHPIAGQGFNLGLRDAWDLADVVRREAGDDIGAPSVLARYRALRATDRKAGIAFTDSLVRMFSNDMPALRWVRGGGLALLDTLPRAKRAFVRRMIFGASPE